MIKIFFISVITLYVNLFANEVKVIDVKANCSPSKVCNFDVTLEHKDTGWEHYADKRGDIYSK